MLKASNFAPLVDSSSTHSFVHEAVVHTLGLNVVHRLGLSMKAANGKRLQSYSVCKDTRVDIQGETFMMDCYTLPLEGFDVILVVQWLKSLGPIVWDFATLSMAFLRHKLFVKLNWLWDHLGSSQARRSVLGWFWWHLHYHA
jgi:hypothetical protein